MHNNLIFLVKKIENNDDSILTKIIIELFPEEVRSIYTQEPYLTDPEKNRSLMKLIDEIYFFTYWLSCFTSDPFSKQNIVSYTPPVKKVINELKRHNKNGEEFMCELSDLIVDYAQKNKQAIDNSSYYCCVKAKWTDLN